MTRATPELPAFVPNRHFDCVVVGAGVTGCSAALHLAEAGARVCVIDAAVPGAGTSGIANGQIMAELPLSLDRIVQLYGAERGEAVIATTASAPDLVFDLIARHRIACNAERSGWIEGTPFQWGLRAMEKRVTSWQRRGAPVELLGRSAIRDLTGTDAYAGGMLDRRAGTLNPLAYTRGLADAALRQGAAIHGNVEARRFLKGGDGWHVETNRGDLRANSVIVATNAYTGRLLPHVMLPVICLYGAQSATLPLQGLPHVLPQRQGVSDVRKLFFRLDPENRLIIGGPAGLWRPRSGRSLPFRMIERVLRKLFPEIRDIRFEHRWYAKGAAAADLLPHLYEPQPGLFAALGFAGRGLAMGTMLGRVLAQRAQGKSAGKADFPVTSGPWPLGLGAIFAQGRSNYG